MTFNDWFTTPRPWQRDDVESREVDGVINQQERLADDPAEAWVARAYPGWLLGCSAIVQDQIAATIYRPTSTV